MVTMENIIKELRALDLNTITELELEQMLPTFGINGENNNEMPKSLSKYYDTGIKFWQYPNQFSKYLKQLNKYDINSYLEIGCRWGGTFIITNEILKKKKPTVNSYACDLIDMSNILTEYKTYNDFTYIKGSSLLLNKEMAQDQIDLILIDGDHSYEGVKKDFEICKQFNPKYVVFHDVVNKACLGTIQFWGEIKNDYKHYEYVDQYDEVNGTYLGIGLIEL